MDMKIRYEETKLITFTYIMIKIAFTDIELLQSYFTLH